MDDRIDSVELERRTQLVGRDLFARIEGQRSLVFSPAWWDERLMEWTMHDPHVKVQLFRFIDALPQLRAPETVTRHLREYFEEAKESIPTWARFGMRWIPSRGWSARLLANTAHRQARSMARKFIAGSNLDEAVDAVVALRRRKMTFTVDLLGEATITEREADASRDDYLHLIEGLSQRVHRLDAVEQIDRDSRGWLPRVNVSIKLSSLFSQFDPIDPEGTSRIVRERLRPILMAARRHGVFVNIDMEQHAFKDTTLRIFREILEEPEFRHWPDIGIAIQAYLKSCRQDLTELADWARRRRTPIWVRLIKGAYWDYESVVSAQEGWPLPVFEQKWQTDANYEAMTLLLLANRDVLRPAFGSHNIRSLSHAIAAAELHGLGERDYEIQMLFGMGDPIKESLVKLGKRVRVYTPYGQLLPGMAYLVRRLLENTANDSFLRASFTDRVSEATLLMNPQHQVNHAPAKTPAPPSFRNEPVADFSDDEARDAMQQALAAVKKRLGGTCQPVIGGKAISTAETMDAINPSHLREIVMRCGKASKQHALDALAAAKSAFPAWRDTDPEDRCALLLKVAQIIRERRFEMSAWQVYECAKNWREADADVCEAIDFLEYYSQEMCRLANPQRFDLPGEANAYFYEPRGIVVVIAPWNFPLAILTGMAAAALVTGNTVIMKPAEQSTAVASLLMDVFTEVGMPPGVVNFLPGVGEEIGPTLVEHPDTALVAFTGSRGVGTILNKQLAQLEPGQTHFKHLIAELGGKNAIIVDDDADLDEAVAGTVASAFGYQGQKCSACSRVIVLESLHDVFVERLIEATKSLRLGPAEDPGCRVGPVISAESRERIEGYVAKGKQEAKLAYAADPGFLANEGHYVGPHIFVDVSPKAVIAQEEIFGPVLAVIKVRNLDEALQVANGTDYALTGGFFSRSPDNIQRVRREFRVGNLYINRKITGALVARQPFGGYKMSGLGTKAGGPDYLLQFVWPRNITENTMRRGFAPGE